MLQGRTRGSRASCETTRGQAFLGVHGNGVRFIDAGAGGQAAVSILIDQASNETGASTKTSSSRSNSLGLFTFRIFLWYLSCSQVI